MPFQDIIEAFLQLFATEKGRQFAERTVMKFAEKYYRKIESTKQAESEESPNIRVAKEVFAQALYTDEDITQEYLASILASSRSSDGKDESMLWFLGLIRNLSAKQLHLHFLIYRAYHELCLGTNLNIQDGKEIQSKSLYLDHKEVHQLTQIKFSDFSSYFQVLFRSGLIRNYTHTPSADLLWVKPTTLGFELYAIACNKYEARNFIFHSNYQFDNPLSIEVLKNISLQPPE
ncbi:MAG: hypothetical protein OXF30_01865 [Candidatus Saccharibacteria bacterium]|nr:hypothetical protein [Candidatus Saccharibacteria bacterium]